jgi:hypothetical protein
VHSAKGLVEAAARDRACSPHVDLIGGSASPLQLARPLVPAGFDQDVDLLVAQLDVVRPQTDQAFVGHCHVWPARGSIVEHAHVVAAGDQGVTQMRADEPSFACYEMMFRHCPARCIWLVAEALKNAGYRTSRVTGTF